MSLRMQCRLLDLAVPGVGTILAGGFLPGGVVLAAWSLTLLGLAMSVPVFFVHPLRAMALAGVSWMALNGMLVLGPIGNAPGHRPHWRPALGAALAWVAVLAVGLGIGGRFFGFERVPGLGMFPGLLPNEVVLVARTRTVGRAPDRGELWLARRGGQALVGRAAAFGGESLQLDGPTLRVGGAAVPTEALGEVRMATEVPVPTREHESLHVFTEQLGEMRHLAFFRKGVEVAPTEVDVPEGHLFLLADNRSTAEPFDSRQFGPISSADLVGRVLHVVWSPGDGGLWPRGDRIGAWWP